MKWIKDNLIVFIVCILLLVGLMWEFILADLFQTSTESTSFDSSTHETSSNPLEDSPEDDIISSHEKIYVDIKGEVYHPGVYLVDPDDRVIDVIETAGGFTDGADEKQINLAEKVYDEMVIFVLSESEDEDLMVHSDSSHDKIRINHATQAELEQLPGIGATKALAIIQYREENGPFKELEDLQNISGFGAKTIENLAEYIIVP
ncbi:helix-hairpin-helix domain-containing protein [Amphibacillus sp. Q70]|uniref:helix-hairpin-helix domain-containing protein n=1 Tax=Amphibacillus sp. Q70 TaxID=3453416 RepID=UPI003F84C202